MRRGLLLLLCGALLTCGLGAAAPPYDENKLPVPSSRGLYYTGEPPKQVVPVIQTAAPPAPPKNRHTSDTLATDLFGTTSSGGTAVVVSGIGKHFEGKYSGVRDSFTVTANKYQRAFETSGKDKAFGNWQKAQNAANQAGKTATALKWAGTGYSAYVIYRDCENYNNPSNHRHSSLAFLDQAMRGFSIVASSLDLVGVKTAKPLAIGGGIVKELVGGETFAGWANQQDNFVLYGLDTSTDWVNEQVYQAFLKYWFGIHNDTEGANLHGRPPYGVGVYKPNIYLYPQQTTALSVAFQLPALLTATIPDYTGIWQVTAAPDGKLTDNKGAEHDFLFYESETQPQLFDYTHAWLVPADQRESLFDTVLTAYGFNAQETQDFVDFWVARLEPGVDYRMYPQLTAAVDVAMPVTILPAPDSCFRLWFAFQPVRPVSVEPETAGPVPAPQPGEPLVVPLERRGFAVVEWGGFILD